MAANGSLGSLRAENMDDVVDLSGCTTPPESGESDNGMMEVSRLLSRARVMRL